MQETGGVDFVTDAHEAAVQRVAELLQHPDDLTNKLPTLIKKTAMERASVEAQLKTVMEAQLDTTQKGIDALSRSKSLTDGIKNSLLEMDKICGDSENNIKNYPFIQRISRAHNNFTVTKLMVERFQTLSNQMGRIAKLLEKDSKKIIGAAENICLIHYQTQQFSIFRNKILSESRGCSTDVLNTLAAIFKPLDQIEYKLDTYIWDLAKNIIELVKGGFGATIVRLVKIIEFEEKVDEALSMQDFRRPASTEMSELLRGRTVRSFRIKFFDIIREQINLDIKKIYLEQEKDLCSVLEKFNSIIDILTFVHDEFTPLFPNRYNIFHFYVLEYHRSIYNTVNTMTEEEMEPAAVLTLIKWVRDYYESMSARLDVSEDLLEPKLLDGREDEYMASYVTLARGKLTEWLKNILSNETTDFLDRKVPPEMDTSGQYLLTGSVIAFQMFNQQLDVVATTSKGQLLSEIVKECCVVMAEFQTAWIKIVDLEFNKFSQKSNDLNEGLVEYIIALANDCMRSTEFSDAISTRLETMSDNQYRQANLDQVKGITEGFMRIQRRCAQVLIDIIMSDLKPAIEVMHCNQWYEQDVMRLIVGTFEDYGDDFQKHLSEYVFGKITSELAERFVISYIETFRNKNAKFKMPSSSERMRADLDLVVGFFSRTKSAKRAKASFEVIDKIIGLIESNPRTLYIDFYSLWKQFPDMPLDFVEKVLSKRDDLDKATVRDIIDQCKQKGIEVSKDAPATVFSKLSKT